MYTYVRPPYSVIPMVDGEIMLGLKNIYQKNVLYTLMKMDWLQCEYF